MISRRGRLLNWTGGSSPINVAAGGPAGSGDRYLEIDAANRNLGSFNSTQWAGNYLSAGVTSLRFDLNNAGPDAVALRISVFGPQNLTSFASTNAIVLTPASGWVSVEFPLTEAELTRTVGSATFAQTLSNVTRLLIRHDPNPLSEPGELNPATATLGIDNITAVPEPGAGPLLAAGLAAFAIARKGG